MSKKNKKKILINEIFKYDLNDNFILNKMVF